MEALFRLLPGPQPIYIRYGVTTLIVLLAFALRLGIEDRAGDYAFLLYILPITASALLFDRGTGFYATVLSGMLVAVLLSWDAGVGVHIAALAMFVIVSFCLVFMAEGLHRALTAAHEAQRTTDLLLREMSHRVKNKFTMISSIIALQARQGSDEVRAALEDIAGRVQIIATVHDYLQVSRRDGRIAMQDYVVSLCRSLGEALGAPGTVALSSSSVDVQLPPEKALAVGVIVNELVTNAFKYAFHDGQTGRVHVELAREGDKLVLSVSDDGIGCDAPESGLGTRLVSTFAAQLGGKASWRRPPEGGCRAIVEFSA
jgi:two-component sensor histidine kinase